VYNPKLIRVQGVKLQQIACICTSSTGITVVFNGNSECKFHIQQEMNLCRKQSDSINISYSQHSQRWCAYTL